METLKLSGPELEAMKAFYQEELTKTLSKLHHLQSVLNQLGGSASNIDVKLPETVDRPVSTAQSETSPEIEETKKSGKKRGPKSIWGSFILKRLQQLDRPLTYNELVDEAMVFFKLSESKRQTVINAINNSAFRLRKNSNRVDTFSSGGREKFVALKSWFDENGKIRKEYEKKIVKPKKAKRKSTSSASATPKARTPKLSSVGRPAKSNKGVKSSDEK